MLKKFFAGSVLTVLLATLSPLSAFALTVDAGSDITVRESELFSFEGVVSDFADEATVFDLTISWDDASADTEFTDIPVGEPDFATLKSYSTPGTYTVTATATPDAGDSAVDEVTVEVLGCDDGEDSDDYNDTSDAADTFEDGDTVSGYLCFSELDYYGVELLEGETLVAGIVYDVDSMGTLDFTVEDEAPFKTLEVDGEELSFTASEDGTYYVLVDYDAADEAGEYELYFTVVPAEEEEPWEDFDLYTSDAAVSGSYVFTYTVGNAGLTTLDSDSDGYTAITVDGELIPEGEIYWPEDANSADYLDASSTGTRNYQIEVGELEVGIHTIEVCIDSHDAVSETDEENNCSSVTFMRLGSSSSTSSGGSTSVDLSSEEEEDTTEEDTTAGTDSEETTEDDTTAGTDDSDEEVVLTDECDALPFEDVSEEDEFYDAIYFAWCEGVIHGRTDSHFAPEAGVLRGEVAKVIARLFGYVSDADDALPELDTFSYVDVDASLHVAYYIEVLTEEGIFEGYVADNTFRPHNEMTVSEVEAFMTRLMGEAIDMDRDANDVVTRGEFLMLLVDVYTEWASAPAEDVVE